MPFEAKYRGHCANDCGNPIEPGDLLIYDNGELVHEGCYPRPPAAVCDRCHLTKPCECDD